MDTRGHKDSRLWSTYLPCRGEPWGWGSVSSQYAMWRHQSCGGEDRSSKPKTQDDQNVVDFTIYETDWCSEIESEIEASPQFLERMFLYKGLKLESVGV